LGGGGGGGGGGRIGRGGGWGGGGGGRGGLVFGPGWGGFFWGLDVGGAGGSHNRTVNRNIKQMNHTNNKSTQHQKTTQIQH